MLNDRQMQAVLMIAAGSKLKDVEEAVGVSHAQLWRWRQDLDVISALERERASLHERRRDKMWAVHERSMDVIMQSLEEGDPKMAIDVFRIGAPGLTDIMHVDERRQLPMLDGERDEDDATMKRMTLGYTCDLCGKVCKSRGGRTKHR